jgi:hypothetical protein
MIFEKEMEEQLLPIGIDSEVEHVKSEIDRVDAIFTVATGPMGHQEINYHIIDEERDQHTTQQSFPPLLSYRRTVEFSGSEMLDQFQEDHSNCILKNIVVPVNGIQHKTSDDDNRKARFLLPEIDSSRQHDKKYSTKKGIIIFVKTFLYFKYFSQ